jgi:acyl-CoA synthetase (AMP-forming)/AMP-acid ligase II
VIGPRSDSDLVRPVCRTIRIVVSTGPRRRDRASGTLTLLGRGSVCINTAGEKVYPEEVEEVIKAIDGIHDVLVVGVPDEIKAVIKQHLASYKVPKQYLYRDSLGRAPNGKADYKATTRYALEALGISV